MIVTDSAKDSKELCESIKIWLAVAKNPSYESNDKRALYTQAMINLVNRVTPRTTDLDLKDVFRKIDFDSLIKSFGVSVGYKIIQVSLQVETARFWRNASCV